jgi:hypothetical protein
MRVRVQECKNSAGCKTRIRQLKLALSFSRHQLLRAGVHECKRVKVRGAECGVQIFA